MEKVQKVADSGGSKQYEFAAAVGSYIFGALLKL